MTIKPKKWFWQRSRKVVGLGAIRVTNSDGSPFTLKDNPNLDGTHLTLRYSLANDRYEVVGNE